MNRLGFVTEMESVYCAVRTESLYNTDMFRHLITYLLTYSTEQSPSWAANRFLASQEISPILWHP
jgi:hypothetical protein